MTENAMKPYVIGLDLGGTNSVFGIVDARGDIKATTAIKTGGYKTVDEYVKASVEALQPVLDTIGGIEKIKGMGYESVLVITDELDENVYLASRNLHNVLVLEVNEADPVSLIRFPKVLVTRNALAKFEEVLG